MPNLYFLIFALFIAGGIFLIMILRYVGLWFQTVVSGTTVSLVNIIGMSLRKIPARLIINGYINTYKAGIKTLTVADLETHYMAGGNVTNEIRAMIDARKDNPISWSYWSA